MFRSSSRKRHHSLDIWPGFVDALAALLLVIIFVLITFVLAQYYLTGALNDRDIALLKVHSAHQEAQKKVRSFQSIIKDLEAQVETLNKRLNITKEQEKNAKEDKKIILSKSELLSQQVADLLLKIDTLTHALEKTQEEHHESVLHLTQENEILKKKIDEAKTDFAQYRSEFFAKLNKAIGERQDIRIVGDRFVFQSEVLFELGADTLGSEGKKELDQVTQALKEISTTIPDTVPWVLRIDGHTDQAPIRTAQFQSNWELSAARAISVVKYLISQGIPPKRLVAAGFGEHQPLVEASESNKVVPRNRRIEFKLDHR